MNNQEQQMKELENEMLQESGSIGLGCGNLRPYFIFLGQNPSTGLKYCGQRCFVKAEGIGSSQMLLPLLDELKIRKDCYFDNIVKNTTESNKIPTKEEIQKWTPFLLKELEILDYKNPKVKVVAMGNFASKVLTDLKIKHIKISHPARCFHNYSINQYKLEIKSKLL